MPVPSKGRVSREAVSITESRRLEEPLSEADPHSPGPAHDAAQGTEQGAEPDAAPAPAIEPEEALPPPQPPPLGILFQSWAEIVVLFGLMAGMGVLMLPQYRPSYANKGRSFRACYANQKTVVGAMEMYNLDKNTKRTVLDASFFQDLKSGGYLQSIPQDPGYGPGTSTNYQATESNNGIKCMNHGSIQ